MFERHACVQKEVRIFEVVRLVGNLPDGIHKDQHTPYIDQPIYYFCLLLKYIMERCVKKEDFD